MYEIYRVCSELASAFAAAAGSRRRRPGLWRRTCESAYRESTNTINRAAIPVKQITASERRMGMSRPISAWTFQLSPTFAPTRRDDRLPGYRLRGEPRRRAFPHATTMRGDRSGAALRRHGSQAVTLRRPRNHLRFPGLVSEL